MKLRGIAAAEGMSVSNVKDAAARSDGRSAGSRPTLPTFADTAQEFWTVNARTPLMLKRHAGARPKAGMLIVNRASIDVAGWKADWQLSGIAMALLPVA